MLREFIATIFPEICIGCAEALRYGEHQLCTQCRLALPQTDFHLRQDNELHQKFAGKIVLRYALSYLKFTKEGRVQKILHELKYNGNQEIGEMLGEWYGAILKDEQIHQDFDLILPVPLHLSKLRSRGYNQSDCFARGLSIGCEVAWSPDILIRRKATETQTRKSRFNRWLNVAEVFAVADGSQIAGKHILLVDDVMTTGATLEACLEVIVPHQPASVSIATIAVATH